MSRWRYGIVENSTRKPILEHLTGRAFTAGHHDNREAAQEAEQSDRYRRWIDAVARYETFGLPTGKGNQWSGAKSVSVGHSGRLGRHNAAKLPEELPRAATVQWGSDAVGDAVALTGKLTTAD